MNVLDKIGGLLKEQQAVPRRPGRAPGGGAVPGRDHLIRDEQPVERARSRARCGAARSGSEYPRCRGKERGDLELSEPAQGADDGVATGSPRCSGGGCSRRRRRRRRRTAFARLLAPAAVRCARRNGRACRGRSALGRRRGSCPRRRARRRPGTARGRTRRDRTLLSLRRRG